jgi:hypothetical protein
MQYGILFVSILIAAFFIAIVWQNMPPPGQCHGRNCPTQMTVHLKNANEN